MAKVFLDEESVDFSGAEPETVAAAYAVIEAHLGGAGRLLERITLEGEELGLEEAAALERPYEALAFFSTTVSARLAGMCREWHAGCVAQSEACGATASRILRASRADAQGEVVELLESSRSVLEGLGIAQAYSREASLSWEMGFSIAFETVVGAINAVADAVETGASVPLSERVARDLGESWGQMAKQLEDVVLPSLIEEEVS